METNTTNNPAQVAGASFVTMFESIKAIKDQEENQRVAMLGLGLMGVFPHTFVSMDKAIDGAHAIQKLLMGDLVARDTNEAENKPIATLSSWQAGGLLSALDVLLEVLRDGLFSLEQEGHNRRRKGKENASVE